MRLLAAWLLYLVAGVFLLAGVGSLLFVFWVTFVGLFSGMVEVLLSPTLQGVWNLFDPSISMIPVAIMAGFLFLVAYGAMCGADRLRR